MTRLDTIRERHNDFVSSHPCSTDTCDTRVVLDALDESKADTLRMGQNWEDALTQRDAARVHADRLAEALRRLPDDFTIDIRYEPPPEPVAWTVRVADRFVGSDTLAAAIIEAAKEAERE